MRQGRLVGTVRLWHVSAGGVPALMLGPLAVEASCRSLGIGAALMEYALDAAEARGHGAIILLGDAPYYARFGFTLAAERDLHYESEAYDPAFQVIELEPGALEGARGFVRYAEAFSKTGTG